MSQDAVARSIGATHASIARLESGELVRVPLAQLCRALAVVGLELSARACLTGSPLRDAAHAALLEKLRLRLHPSLRWRTEVPFPSAGDLRAWDALIANATARAGVEAETRPRDGQELERRLAIKRRDGGVDRLILLLSDTRSNRALVRERSASLTVAFPTRAPDALAALQAGRLPDADTLILL
jgi:transcriptional regulator with XRE-family HTH domain